MEIANNIAKQLGNATFCLIGAKNLGSLENGLQFQIGRNPKKVQYITIKLNGLDLYDIEFTRITRDLERIVIAEENNIYADMMHSLIEKNTGLITKF